MLFVVDGYNVTRSDPATRDLPLEEQSDALAARLATRSSAMLGEGRVVVVFDGAGGTGGAGSTRRGPIDVRFARAGSADDEIVSIATRAAEKIVLVSNDRELAERVKVHARHGVEVRPSSACFEGAGTGASRKGRTPAPRRDIGLPSGANAITAELKDLWLNAEDEE